MLWNGKKSLLRSLQETAWILKDHSLVIYFSFSIISFRLFLFCGWEIYLDSRHFTFTILNDYFMGIDVASAVVTLLGGLIIEQVCHFPEKSTGFYLKI